MNKTMGIRLGDFQINYRLKNEHGIYYITVEERENADIIKTGTFETSIGNEQVATQLLNLLCENQVGVVHVADVLSELGYAIEID